ncbi:GCN5 family acetyltransferase [Pseudonocardia sulfidoxydans NBRC 16205]|uniref:GCN5 family acetyltransferase n=1 Tax=Pseudonocardia sulfidoxydans NBRC 16205 TaxID=1223511 RepID=A0A511DBS7_9PSEU|nr:GNAT family N-acetyltransferase [Pseudonocardia sulfidoxydans]GEL21853.1 GCN5 family acetyltransferase [Pseudonocardia sulfidoxydans NBRC 16205]
MAAPDRAPELRIATPAPEHAGEMLTVQRAAYVTEAQRYHAPGIPPLRETVQEIRADLAGVGPALVARAAWLGPRLVGSVRGRADGAAMEVVRFTVAPDVQGGGVGRALLQALHAAAPASVGLFWLVTGSRSDDNLRFYGAAGYRATGTVVDDAGVQLVRMERARDPEPPQP